MARRRTVILAVALVAIIAGLVVYLRQGSAEALLARKGTLASVEAAPLEARDAFAYTEVTARGSTGLVVHARVRAPLEITRPLPGAVLVGGLKRGRRIVGIQELDAIARGAVLVSPDYALDQHRRAWQGRALATSVVKIRPAALDAVAGASLLLDYLASRPDVRKDALFLIGSSLGAPVVTIAGAIDTRPRAIVALYGGGNLGTLLTHTLAHAQSRPLPPWLAWITGHALACWIAPLEPVRYVGRIAPRAFLMVNGADDSLVPRDNVQALFDAAHAPKELKWTAGEHVQPDEDALILRLADLVAEWLTARGLLDRPPAATPGPTPSTARRRSGSTAP